MKDLELELVVSDDWEAIIDKRTGKTLAEGHKLAAEDVLFALGYRFDIVEEREV